MSVVAALHRHVAAEAFAGPRGHMPPDPLAHHIVNFAMPPRLQTRLLVDFDASALGAKEALCKTRVIDRHLQTWAELGRVQQVVLLGAGMDTRAWRLQMQPDTAVCVTFFEVDSATVLSVKSQALRGVPPPRCRRVAVEGDVAAAPGDVLRALTASGLDPLRPVSWVLEGLLDWLPADKLPALFKHLYTASAPLSKLIATVPHNPVLRMQICRLSRDLDLAPALAAEGEDKKDVGGSSSSGEGSSGGGGGGGSAPRLPAAADPTAQVVRSSEEALRLVAEAGWNAVLLTERELELEFSVDLCGALSIVLGSK